MKKTYLEDTYNAKIDNSREYYYPRPEYIDISTYSDNYSQRMVASREQGISITMAKDDFFRLEYDLRESKYYKQQRSEENFELGQIRRQTENEKQLREQHLALQQAYEKYQNLLALVKTNK